MFAIADLEAHQSDSNLASLYPLSPGQQRIWFLEMVYGSTPVYNCVSRALIRGKLSVKALAKALRWTVIRHESLRTVFPIVNGLAVQRVETGSAILLRVADLRAARSSERIELIEAVVRSETLRPYDLSKGPLLRALLLHIEAQTFQVVVSMHHIVTDAWSMRVFLADLLASYEIYSLGDEPRSVPDKLQYRHFAMWQLTCLEKKEWDYQFEYWRHRLEDLPRSDTFHGRRLSGEVARRGRIESITLAWDTYCGVRRLAANEESTPFMIVLAAFKVLIAKYNRIADVLIGTSVANRSASGTESLIGFLVNTLVLRTDLSGNPTFREVVGRVRTTVLDALTHQDVPFDQIVASLNAGRPSANTPLFNIFAEWHSVVPVREMGTLQLIPLESFTQTAKFDLSALFIDCTDRLECQWEYDTAVFEAAAIKNMLTVFRAILTLVLTHPNVRYDAIRCDNAISPMLTEFNDEWHVD